MCGVKLLMFSWLLGLNDKFHTEPSQRGQLLGLKSDRSKPAEKHSPGETYRTLVQTGERQQQQGQHGGQNSAGTTVLAEVVVAVVETVETVTVY